MTLRLRGALFALLFCAAPLFAHYGEFGQAEEELFRPLEPVRYGAQWHFGADFSANFIFAQFDLWNGIFASRWGERFGFEADLHWGWEMEELRETVAWGFLFGDEGAIARGFLSLRGGLFHPADFGSVSPWLGVGWSQEWKVAGRFRLEGGTEAGVRLGDEFAETFTAQFGLKETRVARCWAALFLKAGI